MEREVKIKKLVPAQTLDSAATLQSEVINVMESNFDIVLNAKVRAGQIAVLSVSYSDNANFTNPVEVTDLDRFVKNDPKSDLSALEQTAITSANSDSIVRVGIATPFTGKPYAKVSFAVTGASVDMDVYAFAMVETDEYPVVQ